MAWSAKQLALAGVAAIVFGMAGTGIGLKSTFNHSAEAAACTSQQCAEAAKENRQIVLMPTILSAEVSAFGLALLLINKSRKPQP